jgi:hypothetical protein
MSVRRSAGAIFWGLTLVSVGGLLLAHNLGYSVRIWPYVIRYWPALLVGWGLLKFVDYFRFRHAGDNRPLFSGGEVAFLIFLIFAGSAITTLGNVSPDLGSIFDIRDLDLWDITGNSFTFDQHQEMMALDESQIQITNMYGSVEVRPSNGDQIILDVKKTVRASNREEAERFERDFTFSITNEGSNYRIVSSKDGFNGPGRQRFKSSLTIQLPKHSVVHLDNRNGRVVVEGLGGNQEILNRFGEVDVRDIVGQLRVENRNGSVTAENISDSVVITNAYANTTVKDVGGSVEIDTRNGSVDVAGVKGNATITNSYAPINVENVQGNLTITGRNNPIDVQHVEGDLHADSSYQNVNIRDARSAVTITSRNGDLTLSFDRAPAKDVSITARYGNVTLDLPSSASFVLDARTEFGRIDSEFEEVNTTDLSSNNRHKSMKARVGQGGPNITVELRNGDIHFGKRG